MKYILTKSFKSLQPFETDLPNFVILTGVNGVGKSQILEALRTDNNFAEIYDFDIKLTHIKFFDCTTLTPAPIQSVNISKEPEYNNHNSMYENPYYQLFQKFLDSHKQGLAIISEYDYLNPPPLDSNQMHSRSMRNRHVPQKKFYIQAKKVFDQCINNLPENFEDFKEELASIHDPFNDDLFTQNFSAIFKNYQKLIYKNELNDFKNKYRGEKLKFLNETEFQEINGKKPWEIINKIMIDAGFDYEFRVPDYDPEQISFSCQFIKKSSETTLNTNDLSSGEKTLISLFFALFNRESANSLPQVILLDETDASLHPSMSKKYLKILKNIFVQELGIKVILTTHSPSTVALADEGDIFVVKNSKKRIHKCTKDEALLILTEGVPSLCINHENRKQVFVESPNDVVFYEKIYGILKFKLESEISLNFISSGTTKIDRNSYPVANCAQVKEITKTMRAYGNKSCYGIIDWDLTNKSSDGVYVNALDTFYSIENCILNPLSIGLILIYEKVEPWNELEISIKTVDSTSQHQLQKIVNWVIEKLSLDSDLECSRFIELKLVNDLVFNIPDWFAHYQGHELETKVLNTFPSLKKLKRNDEKQLKVEVINKIFSEFPELTPFCFLEVFKLIQTK